MNEGTITLVREAHTVPPRLHGNAAGGAATELVPFHAGQVLQWRVAEDP